MSSAVSNALDEVRARSAAEASAAGEPVTSNGPQRLALALEVERARWFYWVPVLVGLGIAVYFALPVEPPLAMTLLPLAFALALRIALPRTTLPDMLTAALVLAAFGFALIAVRTALVAAPVLERRMSNVEVRGVVERIEPRVERGERVTLRVTGIGDLAAERTPRRIRVRTAARMPGLAPGDALVLRATLSPPPVPALPGDFDFARHAYYQGLGAVGFAIAPPRRVEPVGGDATRTRWATRAAAAVERLRQAIGDRVTAALPGETGGIAVALITGERGAISEATNDAYRASGLFHILSISGLHMAIMGGAVFWIVRLALAMFASVALRWPIKKWAAVAAVAAALGYLAISGGSFATVRSFIMIAIMFLAVLLDRPALALRNVAISALVILLIYPESLLDVGFQMSFAAVVALVGAYEAVRDRLAGDTRGDIGMVLRVALFFGGIVLSTLVASVAVAPFAAYHFHQSQQFAVLANLLAVPITNLVVMPAALATLVAMPFGGEGGPLWVMGLGIDAMTWTARQVAALPGAVLHFKAMPTLAFALMLAGGLWALLWHARWRLLGLAPIIAGVALAPFEPRPDLLVGRDGRLVAIRGDAGRYDVLAPPQSRFEVERWLEYDGDARSAEDAVAATARQRAPTGLGAVESRGLVCDAVGCVARIAGTRIAVPRHPSAVTEDCASADVLVVEWPLPRGCATAAALIDAQAVRTAGTHAIYFEGPRRLRIVTVAGTRGARPWAPPPAVVSPGAGGRSSGRTAGSDAAVGGRWAGSRPASRLADFAQPALADALRAPRADDEEDAGPLPHPHPRSLDGGW
jgi:competence protein ComEC